MKDIVLTANQIHKSFGSLEVLKGVDLTLSAGEILSITGKSGSGKSTLLHICGTLDKPTFGSLSISGMQINNLSNKKLANFRNSKIGFVFQFHHLLAEFSALENILIPSMIAHKNARKSKEEAIELLKILQIYDRKSHKPNQMSGGEQQRVAIARALINKPEIVFADEPTGNLDSATSADLHKLIFELRDKFNLTFVIVTHNEELARMSDRYLVMKDGLLV